MSDPKNIVIVGGGAAATSLASVLETSLSKIQGYNIILITGRDYFFHLVAGLRANVSDADIAERICVPYDKLFKNSAISRTIMKMVTEVKAESVILQDGEEIPYAYLVMATGKQWMTPVDVPDTRVAAIEQMKSYRAKVKEAKNILVVGGGAVGIEIAGEVAGSYSSSDKKVTLIHSQSKLMNATYTDKFRDGLQKQLLALGVNLHLGDKLEGDYDFVTSPHTLTTKNGETFNDVDLIITATGGKVNTKSLEKFIPDLISTNGVKVKPTFQVEGHDNIFVIGDLADLKEQKQVAKVPGHVSVANANIVALINNKPLSVNYTSLESNAVIALIFMFVPSLQNYKQPGELIVVNIADKGGMGYMEVPVLGKITLGAWFAKAVKGKELFITKTRAGLGY